MKNGLSSELPELSVPSQLDPSASPTLIYRPESFVDPLDFGRMFGVQQPLELELGSGDGSFLARYAAAHPEHNFIGVERLLGRLRKLDRKGQRAGLRNLRLIRLEASYVLDYMIPPGSIRALHIYFPDPWPKRRHHKNRLINAKFTESAWAILEPGGKVYLRTDDRSYFEQMTAAFSMNRRFRETQTPEELSSQFTDFERGFHARGIATLRAAYERAA
jgi:tRNA (guanine-N7-)-methyltransferase